MIKLYQKFICLDRWVLLVRNNSAQRVWGWPKFFRFRPHRSRSRPGSSEDPRSGVRGPPRRASSCRWTAAAARAAGLRRRAASRSTAAAAAVGRTGRIGLKLEEKIALGSMVVSCLQFSRSWVHLPLTDQATKFHFAEVKSWFLRNQSKKTSQHLSVDTFLVMLCFEYDAFPKALVFIFV